MHDAEEAVMKGFLSGAMIILEDEFVQASFRDPFERVLESICRQLKTCLSFVCFNLQKYGSGRAQLGLDGIAPESISDRKEEDARPALKEYLEFGKAIGADAYCRDAAVAVETAKDFVGRKHNQMRA